MKPIDPAGFERKFRENIDPWNYRSSPFEAHKRRVLLRACGPRVHGRGLELACANGETTRSLAPRCLRLLAIDASATAIREAQRRTRNLRNIDLRRAELPLETPRGPFDLIVASEIAYYLPPNALRILTAQLERALAPGGRIVILHHVRSFEDAAQPPALAQSRMRHHFGKSMQLVFDHQDFRFHAVAFTKPCACDRAGPEQAKASFVNGADLRVDGGSVASI